MKKVLFVGIMMLVVSATLSARVVTQTNPAAQSGSSLLAENKEDQTAKAIKSADAAKYYDLGVAHYESKRFKEAVEAFKRAIRLKPDEAKSYYSLGQAYYSLNSFKDAADAYKQALRFNPEWAEAHYRLGWVYHILGNKELSVEEYKILQSLNSELADKLDNLIKNGARSVETRVAATPITAKDRPAPPSPSAVPANEVASNSNPPVTSDPTLKPSTQTSTLTSAGGNGAGNSVSNSPAPVATEDVNLTNIYRVGAGDLLDIRLLDTATNRSTLYTVLEGGLIEYPLTGGSFVVAGMTTTEITAKLAEELKRRGVQEEAKILVSVRQYNSHNVIISGLVNNPGTRILRREAVPLYVLLAEAQPRADAARAVIMRVAGPSPVIDLTDSQAMNTLVRPGDVITVSARPQQFYFIGGRVNTPGQKVFQPGISLTQAILAAGGLMRSDENKVEVSREGADGRLTTTKFSLKDIREGKVPDPRLQPGDRIEVGR